MGRDLYELSAAARAVFDQADAILGFALSHLCFEGPEDVLTATENAQPALLTVSAALLAVLAERHGDTETRRQTDDRLLSRSPGLPVSLSFVAGGNPGGKSAAVPAGRAHFFTPPAPGGQTRRLAFAAGAGGAGARPP